MKTVQATEAKAKFSALLSDVERGETVCITRHGKVVARIVPQINARSARTRRAMEAMEELRKSRPPTGLTIEDILEMRHEGHRY